MEQQLQPGPRIPDVLTMQQSHRSQAIWEGEDVRSHRCRAHIKWREKFRVSDRVVDFLRGTQFYGVHRLAGMKIDVNLISALVERWRQETHSFHLPVGEATITLQDVQVILGLGVGGEVISGDTSSIWSNVVEELLGMAPDEDLVGASLRITWLTGNFQGMPENANEVQVQQRVRAYLLILIATILFPDKSGNDIQVIYLPLLRNLSSLGNYSWGSAVLATMYRNLCRSSHRKSSEIGGPLILLQLWAWERIAIGRPIILGPRHSAPVVGVHPFGAQHQFRVDPLGCRWLRGNQKKPEGTSSLRAYRDALDSMAQSDFKWQPYTQEMLSFLPEFCQADREDWTVIAPMICFDIVEWHFPDRVARQFGWRQHVPPQCDTSIALHKIDKRGAPCKDWVTKHNTHISLWMRRQQFRFRGEINDGEMRYYDPYMIWYRDHTRLFISPIALAHQAEYRPSTGPIHLLTQLVSDINLQCDNELRTMPREVPPHYRSLISNIRDSTTQCLQTIGYDHLLQASQEPPTQEPPMQGLELEDHSPLIQYTRRLPRTCTLSPIIEGNTPSSSGSTSKRRQPKRKKRT